MVLMCFILLTEKFVWHPTFEYVTDSKYDQAFTGNPVLLQNVI